MSLSKQILEVLQENPRMQYNAKALYDVLYGSRDNPTDKKMVAKIRTELKRLSDRNKIRRRSRGFYQAKAIPKVLKALENPEIELHGIKLECKLIENNTLGVEGIPAQNNTIGSWMEANKFEPTTGNRWFKHQWWNDRKITITIHSRGLVEIFIHATNHPLALQDFLRCLDYLDGFFSNIVLFKRSEVKVRQVGLARDFEHLRLEGVQSISLRKFVNDWCQIYNKNRGVRMEHHLTLKMNLEDAINSLSILTSYTHNQEGMYE